MKLLKYFCLLPSAFCFLLVAGCEWTTGGSVNNWHTVSPNIDFSGKYVAPDGGVLVRKTGTGSSPTTNTIYTTNSVAGELLATGNGTATAFSGALANANYLRGTLTIVVGGYRINDPGSASAGTVALTIAPADGSTGTLNLNTGAWTLSFPAAIANGTQFLAAYQYLSSVNTTNSNQGNHGNPIYSMVLYQQGNTIQIIDNCNSRYDGTIGNISSNTLAYNAQFFASGYSQGYNVEIIGTMTANFAPVIITTNVNWRVSYLMKASFIEEGGYNADIYGGAQ